MGREMQKRAKTCKIAQTLQTQEVVDLFDVIREGGLTGAGS
jgi:hypothetical protein